MEKNLESKFNEDRALKTAKDYVKGLNLHYKTSYEAPTIANYRRLDPSKPPAENNRVPVEYQVQVKVTDKDKTEVYFTLFVDSRSGRLREDQVWNPTKEQISAALEGKKQHYVLIMAETEKDAQRISDSLYGQDGVVSSAYGDKKVVRQMESNSLLAFAHGARNNSGPKSVKVKPKENERRDLVKRCQVINEEARR